MELHEIYGLPAGATPKQIEEAAKQHARECARGQHGAVGPVLAAPPAGMEWDQAGSRWVPAARAKITYVVEVCRDGEWHIVGQYAARRQADLIAQDYASCGERARVTYE